MRLTIAIFAESFPACCGWGPSMGVLTTSVWLMAPCEINMHDRNVARPSPDRCCAARSGLPAAAPGPFRKKKRAPRFGFSSVLALWVRAITESSRSGPMPGRPGRNASCCLIANRRRIDFTTGSLYVFRRRLVFEICPIRRNLRSTLTNVPEARSVFGSHVPISSCDVGTRQRDGSPPSLFGRTRCRRSVETERRHRAPPIRPSSPSTTLSNYGVIACFAIDPLPPLSFAPWPCAGTELGGSR